MLGNTFADFKSWLNRPFSADMNTTHWFMFIGLLIVLMALWRIILNHVTES